MRNFFDLPHLQFAMALTLCVLWVLNAAVEWVYVRRLRELEERMSQIEGTMREPFFRVPRG